MCSFNIKLKILLLKLVIVNFTLHPILNNTCRKYDGKYINIRKQNMFSYRNSQQNYILHEFWRTNICRSSFPRRFNHDTFKEKESRSIKEHNNVVTLYVTWNISFVLKCPCCKYLMPIHKRCDPFTLHELQHILIILINITEVWWDKKTVLRLQLSEEQQRDNRGPTIKSIEQLAQKYLNFIFVRKHIVLIQILTSQQVQNYQVHHSILEDQRKPWLPAVDDASLQYQHTGTQCAMRMVPA